MNRLRNNQDIIILPAVKGNSTVVLKAEDYRRKMKLLLNNPLKEISKWNQKHKLI